MRKTVTEEEHKEWIRRYLNGESCRSISKDYSWNENTISRYINKQGISRGRGKTKSYIELEQKIIQEYQEDKKATFTSLSKKYNISDRTISQWIKKANIPIKNLQGVITNCDKDFFKNINTPDKAYLLGFITADGAVVWTGNHASCSIEVHEKDKEVLEFARQRINPQATLTPCFYKTKRNYRISFSSTELCKDLEKYGIVQNKSLILKQVPIEHIPQHLLPFYFRGLVDGDGSIIKKQGGVSIYSGSLDFITSVQTILCEEINLTKLKIYHGTTYFVSWTSKKDRQKLFNYLYGDLEATYYYPRKYQRMKERL